MCGKRQEADWQKIGGNTGVLFRLQDSRSQQIIFSSTLPGPDQTKIKSHKKPVEISLQWLFLHSVVIWK